MSTPEGAQASWDAEDVERCVRLVLAQEQLVSDLKGQLAREQLMARNTARQLKEAMWDLSARMRSYVEATAALRNGQPIPGARKARKPPTQHEKECQ